MNEIKRTLEFFQEAVPNPTETNRQVQRGCHFEEVFEEMDNLMVVRKAGRGCATTDAQRALKKLADSLKKGDLEVTPRDRVEDLDALVDQIVTSVGKAHMMGYDILAALKEVNDSNFSKFEDGVAIFDVNGKIKKGKNYFKPDLTKMV